MTEETISHSKQQAIAQLESIREMIAALDCDYERLEELREAKDDYEPDDWGDEFLEGCPACGSGSYECVPLGDADRMTCADCGAEWVENDAGHKRPLTWEEANPDDAEELAELTSAAGECESEDQARERIEEDPLSILVRSDWHSVGETGEDAEFEILLCTGGPACRIVGELSNGEPHRAWMEHQDWGTPWTHHYEPGADDVLLRYASFFLGS